MHEAPGWICRAHSVAPAPSRRLAPRLKGTGENGEEEVLADRKPRRAALVSIVVHGPHESEVLGGGQQARDDTEGIRP